ncbi:MAG TPA: aminotransferase class I/II-fold pyridoxal phosphate-dependent enzyme [Acidimicrobiia bacterium]|nr:aminotransferase class I/II-fold pyridoxal phosphate-dependent enzyme [Acidimicrobiia bacterium]
MSHREDLDPETASVSEGYQPERHLGSVKPPIYQTSTFATTTAAETKRYLELLYGLVEPEEGEEVGFIYSRLDNPNLGVVEARLASWEGADDAIVCNSGMSAITTVLFTLLRPGDLVLYSSPLYGGTATVLGGIFAEWGIEAVPFAASVGEDELGALASDDRLGLIYLETPANPTNDLFDIAAAARVAKARDVPLAVDNTFLSPVWQRPLEHGADLVIHSATKYLGGHSDLTAGAVCGDAATIVRLRHTRYRIGSTADPMTAWLLGRSLETLGLRVRRQTENATAVAAFLDGHPAVNWVNHLSLLVEGDPRREIYDRQCRGPGAMISFEVVGGEAGAFSFLDALKVVRLAVSLGGTESLASHPWTTSHAIYSPEDKLDLGITPGMIRLSVGVESSRDLMADLDQALGAAGVP